MSVIRYRPEIDGMRTLAILPVVLFHLGCSWIPGGFMGVDVFFVISGFLITSIILKERDRGEFTLRGFWSRRIRRIMPALLVMVAVVLAVGFVVLFTTDLHRLADTAKSTLTVSANFKMLKLTGDYWGPAAESFPLLHMWSLAVEEQFYLIYPLLLVGLLRMGPRCSGMVLGAMTLASFGACVWLTGEAQAKAFYWPHTRAWELLLGCLGAMAWPRLRARSASPLGGGLATAGLLLVLASYFLIGGNEGFPGYKALLPAVGCLLVLLFADGDRSGVERVLSSRPLVYIGRLSYSLYLWHWPVIVFARQVEKSRGLAIPLWAVVAVFIVLSVASLELVERWAKVAKRLAWAVAAGVALVFGLVVDAKRQQVPVSDFAGFAPVEWTGNLYNADAVLAKPLNEAARARLEGIVIPTRSIPASGASVGYSGLLKGPRPPAVMMWGDSHALMWAGVVDAVCAESGHGVCFQVANGVPPYLGSQKSGSFTPAEKLLFDEARLVELQAYQPRVLIVVASWTSHLGNGAALRELLKTVRRVAPTTRVVLPLQPPMAAIGDVNALQFAAWRRARGGDYSRVSAADEPMRRDANRRLVALAREFSNVELVDTESAYRLENGEVRFAAGGQLLYIDDDHLSSAGALLSRGVWADSLRAVP